MLAEDRPTARRFVDRLDAVATDAERTKLQRYFKSGEGEYGEGDEFIGVRMGTVFALADEFRAMPLGEIEALLESPDPRSPGRRRQDHGQAGGSSHGHRRRASRTRRAVPAAHRPHQQLGPRRPRRLGCRRSLPGRPAARPARRPRRLGEPLGAPHGDPRHAVLRPARRPRRCVRDRRTAARRRRGPHPQGGRRRAARVRQARPRAADRLPRPARRGRCRARRCGTPSNTSTPTPEPTTDRSARPRRTADDRRRAIRRSSSSPAPAAARSTGTASSPSSTAAVAPAWPSSCPPATTTPGCPSTRRRCSMPSMRSTTPIVVVAQSLGGFTGPFVCAQRPVEMSRDGERHDPPARETPGDWWGATGQAEARRAFADGAGARGAGRPARRLLPRRARGRRSTR